MFKAPEFWWRDKSLAAKLLSSLSAIYGYFADKNFTRKEAVKLDLPVLCVGNYTLGGSGKTPMVASLVSYAISLGLRPVVIMRGYGGSFKEAKLVDKAIDTSADIGDEALLLVEYCDVIVAKNRVDAKNIINNSNYDLVILDDGFQSRRIYIDYSLIVVDATRGVGNQCVFPAGPLRASLDLQLAYTDALVAIHQKDSKLDEAVIKGKILYHANLLPKLFKVNNGCLLPLGNGELQETNIYGLCAIGNGNKFHTSLQELGANIVGFKSFPDHHVFSRKELQNIVLEANNLCATLAITMKDYVRMSSTALLPSKLYVVDAVISIDDSTKKQIIDNLFAKYNK